MNSQQKRKQSIKPNPKIAQMLKLSHRELGITMTDVLRNTVKEVGKRIKDNCIKI